MASKEPENEYEEYDDYDDGYDQHYPTTEETSFKTPVPGQVQQLKPDRNDPHRTVSIKEGTPDKNATNTPAAPIKPVENLADGLRANRLIRANLFQADNNTEARNVPEDGEQQSDCEGDGGYAHSMNNAPENDNEHDNDSMYTGSSGGSSGNHKKSDCWEHCDIYEDSTGDNERLHGVIGHDAPSSLLETGVDTIFAGLYITPKLTAYYNPFGSIKGNNTTIQAICHALMKNREHIVTAIIEVTTTQGSQARERILTAYNMIKNDGVTHRLVIYAIMCWFWIHHEKSNMKAAFRSITKDYILAPDEATIKQLKQASSQGSTLNLICPDHMLRTDLFPGFSRLALLANQSLDHFKQVAQNWYELWTCFANFACQEDYGQPRLNKMEELLKKFDMFRGGYATPEEVSSHEFCNQKSIIELIALLHERFLQIDTYARSSHQEQRIPSLPVRRRTFVTAVIHNHPKVWKNMELRILVNNINIDDMTYAELVAFTSEADRPLLASSDTISYAKTMLGLSQKQSPTNRQQSKDSDSQNLQRRNEFYKPVFFQQNGHVYEALTGAPLWANQEDRLKAMATGQCGNCLNYKPQRYPSHNDAHCPFTLPSCKARTGPGPFSPVAPLNNVLHTASDAETTAAFLKARTERLTKGPPLIHGGKGTKGGKDRPDYPSVTLQPMQVRSHADIQIDEIDPPEPPHVAPTLPPSPWSVGRGSLGWCNVGRGLGWCNVNSRVDLHHMTVKPYVQAFLTTDVPGYASPRPATIGAPIDLTTASLLNTSTDEMANIDHASASDDEMVSLYARSSEEPNRTCTAALSAICSTPHHALRTRAIQLGVTPNTLIEALHRIPDEYLANIITSYANNRVRSELVHNAPVGNRRLMLPMDVPPIMPTAVNTLHIAEIEPDPGDATPEEACPGGTTDVMHTVLTRFIDHGVDAVHSMNPGRRIDTDEEPNHKAITTTAAPSFDPGGHAVECRSISEFSNRFITGAITANHFQ